MLCSVWAQSAGINTQCLGIDSSGTEFSSAAGKKAHPRPSGENTWERTEPAGGPGAEEGSLERSKGMVL
jgi:hypothetical protein